MKQMERINALLRHPDFLYYLEKNEQAERSRRFCLHTVDHYLAVARIAMLLNLQENLKIGQEMVYAAALLHDIGRFLQEEEGISHEEASAMLAKKILVQCRFSESEIIKICEAIKGHRRKKKENDSFGHFPDLLQGDLGELLYCADKMSRNCFACKTKKECNWSDLEKDRPLIV